MRENGVLVFALALELDEEDDDEEEDEADPREVYPVRSQSGFKSWQAHSHESEYESLESESSESSEVSLESGSEESELELDSSEEATPMVVNVNFHL